MANKYKQIEHTADVGIEVYGGTIRELFENSAAGMYSFMTDIADIKSMGTETVTAEGVDYESLLINWLNNLLYLTSTKQMIFGKFRVIKFGEFFLEAEADGEYADVANHPLDTEIKAATYHGLKINKDERGYSTTIIFDV